MDTKRAVVLFLSSRRVYCSPCTVEWYGYMLADFSKFKRIEGLTRSKLERFFSRRHYKSRSSWADEIRAVRIFCKWCCARGYLRSDPSAGLKFPKLDDSVRCLSANQIKTLLRSVCCDRDEVLIHFMAETGLRASEIVNLKIADLDFDARSMRVLGKGSRIRLVGVPRSGTALQKYLGARKRGYVFLGKKGKLTRFGLREIFRRLSKRVGFRVYPHMFRHTFGTNAVASGLDPAHVQQLLGHARIETTEVYVKASRQRAALDAQLRVMG